MKKKVNKRILLSIGALTCASTLLAGCNTLTALPGNYNEPIVKVDGVDDIYDNRMSAIYDAIVSDKTQKVLDEVLMIIAKEYFGDFYSELKVAYNGTDEEKDAYIEKHKDVFVREKKDEDDKRLGDKEILKIYKKDVDDVNVVKKLRRDRFNNFYKRIEKRIVEKFYNEVIGDTESYTDRGIFDEERFAKSKYNSYYNVTLDRTDFFKGYLPPEFKKDNLAGVIKLNNGETDPAKLIEYYKDYIEREFIPNIYRELLVEQYIYNESYMSIVRSHGRNVNIVKLSSPSEYPNAGNDLLKAFSDKYIFNTPRDASYQRENDIPYETLFNAWKGFVGISGVTNKATGVTPFEVTQLSDEEVTLQENANFEKLSFDESTEKDKLFVTSVYKTIGMNLDAINKIAKQSEFGMLLDKYEKSFEIDAAANKRFVSEEAINAENEFTNSHAYDKETGLKIKVADLARKKYLTDGWHIKNGGLSDLSDTEKIRSRLFNIKTANEIDSPIRGRAKKGAEANKYKVEVNVPTTNTAYDPSNYLRNINYHYFLTPKTNQKATENPRNFIMKPDSADLMVEVLEATSASKLLQTGTNRYCDLQNDEEHMPYTSKSDPLFMETTAFELAEIIASKESFTNDAYAHYIKQCDFIYHDNTIYEFFKSKFPELFDEKDDKDKDEKKSEEDKKDDKEEKK